MLPKLFGTDSQHLPTKKLRKIEYSGSVGVHSRTAHEIKKFPAKKAEKNFYPISSHCPQPTPMASITGVRFSDAAPMSTQGPEGLRSTVSVQPPSECCDILPWKELTTTSQQGRVFPWVLVWPSTLGNTGTEIFIKHHT